MSRTYRIFAVLLIASATIAGQNNKSQSSSTIDISGKDRQQAIEINNVTYVVTGSGIPGRPKGESLVLRKTIHTHQVINEKGIEGSSFIEAWPLGVDLKTKPLYGLSVNGVDPTVIGSDLLVIARGLEDTEWWSVYKLGNGQRLFDTYVPLTSFSTSREIQTMRYVGLELPADDVADIRLIAPNVVGVLTYASAERVIREALITADNPKRAQLLRSFADSSRSVTFSGGSVRLSISQNFPSPAATVTLTIPIAKDDLDLTRSQLPAGIHIAAWKR